MEGGLKEAEAEAGSPVGGLPPGSRDSTRILKHSSAGKISRGRGWSGREMFERGN